MKKITSLFIVVVLGVLCVHGNTEQDNDVKYSFGSHEISKKTYIHNIRNNVQTYLDRKRREGWPEFWVEEFRNAYYKYINALGDPRKPYRFRTDEFGVIEDREGILGSTDSDDFWYDKKANRITGYEYQKLKDRKKKKYITFEANREVATYFYKIGKGVVKLEEEKEKEKYKTNNKNNQYIGW